MANYLREPYLGFNSVILLLIMSFSAVLLFSVIKAPYADIHNLQFGHILGSEEAIQSAQFSMTVAIIFYGVLLLLSLHQLILHIIQQRKRSWDPSIAMVDVHTPRPKRESTPSSADSTTRLNDQFDDGQGIKIHRRK